MHLEVGFRGWGESSSLETLTLRHVPCGDHCGSRVKRTVLKIRFSYCHDGRVSGHSRDEDFLTTW